MNSSDSTLKKTKRFGIEITPTDLIIGDVSAGINFSIRDAFQFRLIGTQRVFGDLNWKSKINFNSLYSFSPIKNRKFVVGMGVDVGILNLPKSEEVCTNIDRGWRPSVGYCRYVQVQVHLKAIAPQVFIGGNMRIGEHFMLLGTAGFKYYFVEVTDEYPDNNELLPFGQVALQYIF